MSRSLLRTEDKLRAAQQRVTTLQEHNAALLALVEQAAVPGGVGEHDFSRPGGWRERAGRVIARRQQAEHNAAGAADGIGSEAKP